MGHYQPGVLNSKDFIMPAKGIYYIQYDSLYFSNSFYGPDSRKLSILKAGESFSYKGYYIDALSDSKIRFKVRSLGIIPKFIFVAKNTIIGAHYAFFFNPFFVYESVNLKTDVLSDLPINGIQVPGKSATRNLKISSNVLAMGDFFINPIWLDWDDDYFDFWFRYGAYAPIGSYKSTRLSNPGLGFWSHEIVWGGSVYFQKEKTTALVLNLTYEINQKQRHTHIVPGEYFIFEYALSHYPNKHLEFCLTGYSLLQVTDDSGNLSRNKHIKSSANAFGIQNSYWIKPEKLFLSARYLYEYTAKYRTKGQLAGVNLTYVF